MIADRNHARTLLSQRLDRLGMGIIDFMLPLEKQQGRQRQVDFRQVVNNTIFYRADNGIKWRAMPRESPVWQTVYSYYCVLGEKGTVGEY